MLRPESRLIHLVISHSAIFACRNCLLWKLGMICFYLISHTNVLQQTWKYVSLILPNLSIDLYEINVFVFWKASLKGALIEIFDRAQKLDPKFCKVRCLQSKPSVEKSSQT